jgi:hypothetical protein
MITWTWESRGPGAEGCGVSGGEDEAKAAAVAWMREHSATTARAEPVCLDVMESAYVPVGRAIEAARRGDNWITWRLAAP